MSFGERLIFIRNQKGTSQRALALRSGLSNATISRIESNTVKPDFDTVEKIAAALNVTPEYLAGWKEDSISNAESFVEFQTTKDETPLQKRLGLVARKAENLSEEERETLIKHFEESVDLYLKVRKGGTKD